MTNNFDPWLFAVQCLDFIDFIEMKTVCVYRNYQRLGNGSVSV